MHQRIAELLQYIEEERVKLRAAVEGVPVERRGMSLGEGQWSVASVVAHLATVEQRITGLLRSKVAEGRAAGLQNETDSSPILPQLNLDQVLDRTQRFTSPGSLQPSMSLDSDAAWQALESSRRDLRGAVLDADGLALNDLSHPHLYFGSFTLYKWIGFIGAHEARHAAQIREIGAGLAQDPA